MEVSRTALLHLVLSDAHIYSAKSVFVTMCDSATRQLQQGLTVQKQLVSLGNKNDFR